MRALDLNVAFIILECVAIPLSFSNHGWGLFCFYTEDSNFLAMASCAVMVFFLARQLKDGTEVPRWAHVLKFVGTSCLAVTFVVVVCVLAPWMTIAGMPGYQMMLLSGSMLYMHLLCPAAAFVSFAFYEPRPRLETSDIRYAMVPTLAYAVIIVILNIAHVVEGPYPFLRVYDQPVWASIVWVLVIVGVAAFLAWMVLQLNARKAEHSLEGVES